MADTTFVSKVTVIATAWLQDINNLYYRLTGQPTKGTPVGGDLIVIGDSATGGSVKTLSITNLLTYLVGALTPTNAVNATNATNATDLTGIGNAAAFDARYAALAGLSTQVFNAANAVTNTEVVNLGQANGAYSQLSQIVPALGGTIPSAGTSVSQSHTWGTVPYNVHLEVTCAVADNGYSIGDTVFVNAQTNGTTTIPLGLWSTSTLTGLSLASGYSIAIGNKTTGAIFAPAAANWKYRFISRPQ